MESSAAVDLCFYLVSAATPIHPPKIQSTHSPSAIFAMFQLFLASYQAILCSEERRTENENSNVNSRP